MGQTETLYKIQHRREYIRTSAAAASAVSTHPLPLSPGGSWLALQPPGLALRVVEEGEEDEEGEGGLGDEGRALGRPLVLLVPP